jgi:hypothetical protein
MLHFLSDPFAYLLLSTFALSLLLCTFYFPLFVISAAVLLLLAAQWRKWRSGSTLPHCRRVCATTVAAPVFPAIFLRIFAHEIRNTVARVVLPAVHFGDNFRNCLYFNGNCNTALPNESITISWCY